MINEDAVFWRIETRFCFWCVVLQEILLLRPIKAFTWSTCMLEPTLLKSSVKLSSDAFFSFCLFDLFSLFPYDVVKSFAAIEKIFFLSFGEIVICILTNVVLLISFLRVIKGC